MSAAHYKYGSNKAIFTFPTWGALLDHARTAKSELEDHRRSSRHEEKRGYFYGTYNFDEAVSLAISGYSEGAEIIRKIGDPIFKSVSSLIQRQDIHYQAEGENIDVARFVEGEPECWQKFEHKTVSGAGHKIIKVVFNPSYAGQSSLRTIERTGAAATSLIQLLEYAGHRVEITVPTRNSNKYTPGKFEDITSTTIKLADQPMDVGRLAFALMHPSFKRRLIFAVRETLSTSEHLTSMGITSPDSDYGSPGELPRYMQGDIYISVGLSNINSESAARAWIIDQLKAQGVEIREVAAA